MDHDVFCDDGPPISQLQAAVKALDEYVHQTVPPRPSDSTTDENAASRRHLLPPPSMRNAKQRTARKLPTPSPVHLFSRQELVLSKWRELARAHVVIYGLGAVGALAAEALVRAGVGKLLLVDHARVQMSAMGAMGYYPEEVGFSRVQALRLRLQSIARTDTSTIIDSFSADLSNDADLVELKKRLKASAVGMNSTSLVNSRSRPHATAGASSPASSGRNMGLFEALALKQPYDAIICCADDEDAKFRLNEISLQLSLPLLDVDIPPSNAKISLRAVLPGHTCCLECIRQQEASSHAFTPTDQVARSIARAFPASLPHVEATAAGLVAQMAIKFLLDLGEFVPFFLVDMLTFEIESYSFPPNRSCPSDACIERQEEERAAAY
ncbi:hypothetical protein Gpo141_00003209 [Globisporangium polare]